MKKKTPLELLPSENAKIVQVMYKHDMKILKKQIALRFEVSDLFWVSSEIKPVRLFKALPYHYNKETVIPAKCAKVIYLQKIRKQTENLNITFRLTIKNRKI